MTDALDPRDHAALDAALRAWLAAVVHGGEPALRRLALPHAGLGALAASAPPPARRSALRAELAQATWRAQPNGSDRQLVHVWLPSRVEVLPFVRTAAGWRVDARWAVAAVSPDDALRRVARAFYGALLTGDLATMQQHAFDARGLELLAGGAPAPVDRWDLDLQAAMIAFVEVADGESYPTPTGPQPVTTRHRDHGIRVLVGLTLAGEVAFLLRQRDGVWTVIPFLFVQAEVLRRGGSLGPAAPA